MESTSQTDYTTPTTVPAGPANSKQENTDTAKYKCVGLLSNYEVFAYIKELKDTGVIGGAHGHGSNHDRIHQLSTSTHMPTLIYETLRYFKTQNSPCTVQSPDIVKNFVGKLKEFNLTKAEKLTILNLRPTQPVEIQAIVEESEERLTEEQVSRIIQLVEEYLPEVEPEGSGIRIDVESE